MAHLDLDRFISDLLRLGLVEIAQEAATPDGIDRPKETRRDYQSPLLEQEAEIAVAYGVPSITAGPKWA